MSLLEDVFLEDEAGEAQELERVIEGDEYDERPTSPNSDNDEEKEDEAEEDKSRVDPTQAKSKRVVRNPRFILNPARLTGPRGIQVIPEHFKDFKFKGKGHEKEDLDLVLKKLEHWAYRLYPKFEFKDCLRKIETLGKKRPVMVHLHKIRLDQITSEETVVQKDSSDDDEAPVQEEDEFDKLLQQQIELARSTPAPGSVKKPMLTTPSVDHTKLMTKATSSPSISEEQKERMLRNKKLAEERRLAKLKNDSNATVTSTDDPNNICMDIEGVTRITDDVTPRKHNRSNVIDSSDEDEELNVNSSVIVDVHSISPNENDQDDIEIINEQSKSEETVKRMNDSDKNVDNENLSKDIPPTSSIDSSDDEINADINSFVDTNTDDVTPRKHNRLNVIDSSDEEEEVNVNSSVIVDVHSISPNENDQDDIEIINEQCKSEETGKKINDSDKNVDNENLSKDIPPTSGIDSSDDKNNADINSIVDTNETDKIMEKNDDATDDDNRTTETILEATEGIENNDDVLKTVTGINRQDNIEKGEICEKAEMELSAGTNKKDSTVEINKENIENVIASEIMDVDFNDDF